MKKSEFLRHFLYYFSHLLVDHKKESVKLILIDFNLQKKLFPFNLNVFSYAKSFDFGFASLANVKHNFFYKTFINDKNFTDLLKTIKKCEN